MKERPELKVVYRQVNDLIPYARNARTHSDEQVTRIASSIKEFGFTNPILIDGDNGILCGHGRLAAAKKLGLREVPTIELSGMTDAQKRAYILADNKLALDAGWDESFLKLELKELEAIGADLDLTGFDDEELTALLADDEGDEFPELPDNDLPSRTMMLNFKTEDEFQRFNTLLEEAKDRSGLSGNAETCLYMAEKYNEHR